MSVILASAPHYEVEYFAAEVGLTSQQVRDLIKTHGNKQETLDPRLAT